MRLGKNILQFFQANNRKRMEKRRAFKTWKRQYGHLPLLLQSNEVRLTRLLISPTALPLTVFAERHPNLFRVPNLALQYFAFYGVVNRTQFLPYFRLFTNSMPFFKGILSLFKLNSLHSPKKQTDIKIHS